MLLRQPVEVSLPTSTVGSEKIKSSRSRFFYLQQVRGLDQQQQYIYSWWKTSPKSGMERAKEMLGRMPCTKSRCDGPPACILRHRPGTVAFSSNFTLEQINREDGSRQPCKDEEDAEMIKKSLESHINDPLCAGARCTRNESNNL